MLNKIKKELINNSFIAINNDYDAEYLSKQIIKVIDVIKESNADGDITYKELENILIELIDSIFNILKNYCKSNYSLPELIVKIIKYVYYSPDGLDNPNISFVPDIIEEELEAILFNNILPVAAKALTFAIKI